MEDDERDILNKLNDKDEMNNNYNDLIMNYYFLPPEIYVRSILFKYDLYIKV